MKLDISKESLVVYEALASKVRLEILKLLSKKSMNIKEIAKDIGLSSAIISMHVKKLEEAKLIKSVRDSKNGSIQKICSLDVDEIEIKLPNISRRERQSYKIDIPVGHYTDYDVAPTCGLATETNLIGHFDDTRFFIDPKRVDAKLIWFAEGFVEYKIPNYLLSNQKLEEIEISMEISSEAPNVNNDYPSDISFALNGINLGYWTSPGDFGEKRGKYTPKWWALNLNQYGLYKILKINDRGTYIDGEKMSDIGISDIPINSKNFVFRIFIDKDAKHVGGISIFGEGFGNYNQNIIIKMYYERRKT